MVVGICLPQPCGQQFLDVDSRSFLHSSWSRESRLCWNLVFSLEGISLRTFKNQSPHMWKDRVCATPYSRNESFCFWTGFQFTVKIAHILQIFFRGLLLMSFSDVKSLSVVRRARPWAAVDSPSPLQVVNSGDTGSMWAVSFCAKTDCLSEKLPCSTVGVSSLFQTSGILLIFWCRQPHPSSATGWSMSSVKKRFAGNFAWRAWLQLFWVIAITCAVLVPKPHL